jgi:hypothetical protein
MGLNPITTDLASGKALVVPVNPRAVEGKAETLKAAVSYFSL